MPLWDAIKKHLTDQAGKYIALVVLAVLSFLAWQSLDRAKAGLLNFIRDSLEETDPFHKSDKSERDAALGVAISNFQQGVLGFVKDSLLEKEPNKLPDGKKRNADLARAISDFQSGIVSFVGAQVRKINGAFVGYVQAGTFTLPYPEQTPLPGKKTGTRSHDTQYSFQIFAGNNSHVYLEFEISPFESKNYDIQLYFGEEPACSRHKWHTGFNAVEFEVKDLSSRKWDFIGECEETKSSTPSTGPLPRIRETQGHKGQLIPVRLKMIGSGIAKEPRIASLDEAAGSRSQVSLEARPDNITIEDRSTQEVTVGYIAVVSPLIADESQNNPLENLVGGTK